MYYMYTPTTAKANLKRSTTERVLLLQLFVVMVLLLLQQMMMVLMRCTAAAAVLLLVMQQRWRSGLVRVQLRRGCCRIDNLEQIVHRTTHVGGFRTSGSDRLVLGLVVVRLLVLRLQWLLVHVTAIVQVVEVVLDVRGPIAGAGHDHIAAHVLHRFGARRARTRAAAAAANVLCRRC